MDVTEGFSRGLEVWAALISPNCARKQQALLSPLPHQSLPSPSSYSSQINGPPRRVLRVAGISIPTVAGVRYSWYTLSLPTIFLALKFNSIDIHTSNSSNFFRLIHIWHDFQLHFRVSYISVYLKQVYKILCWCFSCSSSSIFCIFVAIICIYILDLVQRIHT